MRGMCRRREKNKRQKETVGKNKRARDEESVEQGSQAGSMCKLCLWSEQVNFSWGGLQGQPRQSYSRPRFPERELVA